MSGNPLSLSQIISIMSQEQILLNLRQYLIGRTLSRIEFYTTDAEELTPLGEESLLTDGGVVLQFDNGKYFTMGFDLELELNNSWLGLPTGESAIDLPETGENLVPAHLDTPIQDFEILWETVSELETEANVNGSEDVLHFPIMIIFTLENGNRFSLASLSVEEEDEGPLVGLDIEGNVGLILDNDLIDFIQDLDEEE